MKTTTKLITKCIFILISATQQSSSKELKKLTIDDAISFGVEIVIDAKCNTRIATTLSKKFIKNKVSISDLLLLKDKIQLGKDAAIKDYSSKTIESFCNKKRTFIQYDLAQTMETYGMLLQKDNACGTHLSKSMMEGMKARGELPASALHDYATEIESGKRLEIRVLARNTLNSECGEDRRIEAEDEAFARLVKRLGLSEPPTYNY